MKIMFNREYLSSFTCIITVVYVASCGYMKLYSQNAPVNRNLWIAQLYSQVWKWKEMNNAGFCRQRYP